MKLIEFQKCHLQYIHVLEAGYGIWKEKVYKRDARSWLRGMQRGLVSIFACNRLATKEILGTTVSVDFTLCLKKK